MCLQAGRSFSHSGDLRFELLDELFEVLALLSHQKDFAVRVVSRKLCDDLRRIAHFVHALPPLGCLAPRMAGRPALSALLSDFTFDLFQIKKRSFRDLLSSCCHSTESYVPKNSLDH